LRLDRTVVIDKKARLQGHEPARLGRCRAGLIRDDWPVPCDPDLEQLCRVASDRNFFLDHLERHRAVRCQVLDRVFGIGLFDEYIFDIRAGGCVTPSDSVVVAKKDHRRSRHRRAGKREAGRLEPGQIPYEGSRIVEMRIVGKQRFSSHAVIAIDDPAVRRALGSDNLGQRCQHAVER